MFQKIRDLFGGDETKNLTPKQIRVRQLSYLGGISFFVVVGVSYFISISSSSSLKGEEEEKKPSEKTISTSLEAVDPREIWASRLEKKAKVAQEEAEKVNKENQFLQKRVDVLEDLLKRGSILSKTPPENSQQNVQPSSFSSFPEVPVRGGATFPSSPEPMSHLQQQQFIGPIPTLKDEPLQEEERISHRRKSKILHLGNSSTSSNSFKNKTFYLPAGSYSKAVLVSGVVASTATNSQGNPQPIMLRLVDDGNLPRGFKSRVRDAVLLGGCYGDISSERVLCRLETMSWVEPSGITVEKKVEGWVMGEDGRSGLRGEVVDKSSDVAREALISGMLSGMGSFFQMQSTRSVYPVSPFGQTQALSGQDALAGAAASGVGNALNKLAEFSIRRAEQMQPVILVASGRLVDVVFKSGVDLTPDVQPEMKVVGSESSSHQNTEK